MKFKKILLFIGLVIGIALLTINIFFHALLPSFFYSSFFWWLLIFYFICAWNFRLNSGIALWTAFFLFLSSSLLTSAKISGGEFVIRLSLLMWIIGLIQALVEYKTIKKNS